MNNLQFWIKELESSTFSGWNFSYLTESGRMDSEPLNWNYYSLALPHLRQAEAALDMGTGGGEYLSSFYPFPRRMAATEGYKPNIPLAKAKLEPLGVEVLSFENDAALPFQSDEFDLVINKHESFDPNEVKRIVKPSGMFITQQVGGSDMADLNERLHTDQCIYLGWNLESASAGLKKEGFRAAAAKEQFPKTRFYDIGAILYYLKAIPWQIPEFSYDKYEQQLLDIQYEIETRGYIEFTSHRFLIMAIKE
ncbi:class I SAM-dependent methyltransferase [Metabacillus idriensis]|uniref:class I SAM-dependent methyltransferase n=1 Tax=Metabacillus idriensis TaxID=324768 RepID=UPI00174CD5C5|nr:methyltransferase domain-containing protein [Metabacillus idriensis]